MPRVSGVDIPSQKRVETALTYIYGIGRNNVNKLLKLANIDPNKRTHKLTFDEIARLQKAIDSFPTEGALKKVINDNIKRLKQIGSYRGERHKNNLPSRGQRTRHNARTKRGKRKTIGAIKKQEKAKQTNKEGKSKE